MLYVQFSCYTGIPKLFIFVANTSALPTAPQQAGLQNMQYGMNPSIYPTMPLNPAGAFLPSNHLSSQFVVPQYYFQQQPQPHQPIFTQQQLQYFQSQQPQNQAMTLHQEGYPQSQPGMIQQDHQSSKLPITLQQGICRCWKYLYLIFYY